MDAPSTHLAAPGAPPDDEAPAPMAPSVVAVVVAHDPGEWFDEVLEGLAAQDYPSLSVLVIDAGSAVNPSARVAEVLPDAYVRRLDGNPGYAVAANEVLDIVEGATFYLLLHDDVALAPGSVRVMVEEAFRSNAGVVGPKLVRWDDPTRLLQVGMAVDKTGEAAPPVEPGELDQEQHDAVRDVFVVPGACTLIRADLFAALEGFDPGIPYVGDDLDLCWRAQVAGARVLVAPTAVARHLEALDERPAVDDRRRLAARHRLRTMFTCYGWFHLARVVPQAAALTLMEAIAGLASGRMSRARDALDAWVWNVRRFDEIRQNRRALARVRQVADSEVRRLQVRGSARVSGYLRGQVGRGDDRFRSLATIGRDLAQSVRSGRVRTVIICWVAAAVVLLVGSRRLLLDGPAAFGDLPAFPETPWSLLSEWFSGWRRAGLGSEAPQPSAFGLLGLAGVGALGQMGLLRTVLTVGMLPLGALGAWRLGRGFGSRNGRAVALVVYLAIPLPYNALASGRWGGLAVWAATPWIVARLASFTGEAPFDADATPARWRSWRAQVLGLAVVVALLAALAPAAVLAVAVAAVGLVAGGWLVGKARGSGQLLAGAAGAVAVAAVVHLPWTLDLVRPGAEWAPFAGVDGLRRPPVDELLRFETGPIGAAPLGWVFLVAAALALVIGRDWRFTWAVRGWTLAVVAWAAAWASAQSWSPVGVGSPEVLLSVAAAGLALATALGLLAFEVDLPEYRFGWRQLATVIAGLAVVAGLVPVLGAMGEGRWGGPDEGLATLNRFLDDEQRDAGAFRVLWVGDASLLPAAGWPVGDDGDDGVAYALTSGPGPVLYDRWQGREAGPTRLVGDAIAIADRRETSRLGRLLAPMGIRFVVAPVAVADDGPAGRSLPPSLAAALGEQLDLVPVEFEPALVVYRNDSWAPARAVLTADAADAADEFGGTDAGGYFGAATFSDLKGATPVLPGRSSSRWSGDVSAGTVYLASASSPRWQLRVEGDTAPRDEAFGWANDFTVESGGHGTLQYRTPIWRRAVTVGQLLLWVALAVAVARLRREPGGEPAA